MDYLQFQTLFSAAPEGEPERQYYFIDALSGVFSGWAQANGRKPTFCVVTFGCQMNSRDSEKISGSLRACGLSEIEDEENADFVLFNTCTIRENANEHLYGRLGHLKHCKKAHPDRIVAICGCMMQEPDEVVKVQQKYPYVDIIFGTHNLYCLAELVFRLLMNRADERRKKAKERRVVDVRESADRIVEELPNARKYPFKQGVNISFGCNNFCTYCIVPYVRGRERSRKSADILSEVRALAADGVLEVMLLGQNVNSYGNDNPDELSFPELLKKVCAVKGIERVRFMTSHPKDLSDELIDVIAEEPKICRHLHLPMQSGSTRILKAMNRRYTKESYLKLVEKLRQAVPDLSLTTDIIVGFPGETEADFQDTLDVVRRSHFSSAFTFIYSKRTGTPAAKMPDQVPEDVVKDRFQRLLSAVDESSKEACGKDTGKTMPVLVEGFAEGNDAYLCGRLSNNLLVHFKGGRELLGTIIPVRLTVSKGFYYMGEIE